MDLDALNVENQALGVQATRLKGFCSQRGVAEPAATSRAAYCLQKQQELSARGIDLQAHAGRINIRVRDIDRQLLAITNKK